VNGTKVSANQNSEMDIAQGMIPKAFEPCIEDHEIDIKTIEKSF
jgi:hypothetical protein